MAKSKQRRRANQLKRRARSKTPSLKSSPQPDLTTALQLQKQGHFDQARLIYCQILERDPQNADAWHLLGMALFSMGEHAEAINCLGHAIDIVPGHPDVLANLGVVYRGAGDLHQARIVLEQAVSINPSSVAARNNLGTVLLEATEYELAEAQFTAVIKIDPENSSAALNLGNVWQKQGRKRDAEEIYRQVLSSNPNDTTALNNLGEALRHQGQWSEAASVFKQSLAIAPNSVEPRINLGRTLVNLFQNAEAQNQFRYLIERRPELSKPYHYFGKTLFDIGDMEGAATNIEKSLTISPTDIYAQISLGFVYVDMGRIDDAVKCFKEVLKHEPSMSEAHGILLFLMSSDASIDQDKLFDEHKRWGTIHGAVTPMGRHKNPPIENRRLKIGYVSPDFRNHAVATFFRPVLECHDPSLVETYCYAEVTVPDSTTDQLRNLSDHWRSTKGLSDEQVARQIRADEIDILVDLAGHVAGNRLTAIARRPAPIQVTWIGYPNTTGLDSIDYRLTCDVQNPISEPSYHTEQLIRMNGGSFCFSTPAHAPDVKQAPCVESGHVIFGSFHRPLKISSKVRDLWADVLQSTPGSKLLIFHTRFTQESISELSHGLNERGISADRFEIRNKFSGDTYLSVYDEIDIGLDVFPWAGGTTTLEALWMGVPVIALYGERRSARSTAAIMKNAGHPELVADSPSEYVRLAIDLAQAPHRITTMRQGMRESIRQTILNAPRFTNSLESEFRKMWVRWCDSQSQTK